MNARRAYGSLGSTLLVAALVLTGCDAGPPAPIDRGGVADPQRKPSGTPKVEAPKPEGPVAAPSKTASDFPQEVQEKFQRFVTLTEEAKKVKQAFHENESEENHTAAYDKIGEAMNVGYELIDEAPDFPRLNEYMSELGTMGSDLKEFEPK